MTPSAVVIIIRRPRQPNATIDPPEERISVMASDTESTETILRRAADNKGPTLPPTA